MDKNTLHAFYSEDTQKYYKLVSTQDWPYLEISGIRMHQVKHLTPKTSIEKMIRKLKPKGIVLDTCTGLGYSAILLAKNLKVEKVITIECDNNVIKLQKLNKMSEKLFSLKKIEKRMNDSFEEIKLLDENSIKCVFHDPPMFAFAPRLYSFSFYREVYRVLKKNGRFLHYIGSDTKKSVAKLKNRILKNLEKIGFKKVEYFKEIKSILAEK